MLPALDSDNLTTEQRHRYGVKFDAPVAFRQKASWESHPFFPLFAALQTMSNGPRVGWTNGLQWVASRKTDSFRLFDGNKRFVALTRRVHNNGATYYDMQEVYGDPEVVAKFLLFQDEIVSAIQAQGNVGSRVQTHARQFEESGFLISQQTFPKWKEGLSRTEKDDPLMIELIKKYGEEYEAYKAERQAEMLAALFAVARLRGARYISVSNRELWVLEGVRGDSESRSVPEQIGDDLNILIAHIGHNGVEVRLYPVVTGLTQGVYYIAEEGQEQKLTEFPITRGSFKSREINRPVPGDVDLKEWMVLCGAVEPRKF